jgi:hypothetical protein
VDVRNNDDQLDTPETANQSDETQSDTPEGKGRDLLKQMQQFIPHLSVAVLTFAAQNPSLWDLFFTDGGRPKHEG